LAIVIILEKHSYLFKYKPVISDKTRAGKTHTRKCVTGSNQAIL